MSRSRAGSINYRLVTRPNDIIYIKWWPDGKAQPVATGERDAKAAEGFLIQWRLAQNT